MGTKRFTDAAKWRNEWFRTLPQKAKLAWSYLCDECDFCGVWKSDYGLATFQLNFPLSKQMLLDWFDNKLHFFDGDKVLIVGFFEFQYADSKDTWTAKVKARSKLESYGFKIDGNKVLLPQSPTVGDRPPSVLIVGVGVVEGVGKGEGSEKKSDPANELVEFWNSQKADVPKVKSLTKDRIAKIALRLKDAPLDDWKFAISKIGDYSFLCGKNNSGWKADFDWLISNETNRLKIIEGKYSSSTASKPVSTFGQPPKVDFALSSSQAAGGVRRTQEHLAEKKELEKNITAAGRAEALKNPEVAEALKKFGATKLLEDIDIPKEGA